MRRTEVTIYTANRCTYCNATKRLLDNKGIKYREVLIDDDPVLRKEMLVRAQRQTVPQIFIGDVHIGGFDDLTELNHEGKLDELLSP